MPGPSRQVLFTLPPLERGNKQYCLDFICLHCSPHKHDQRQTAAFNRTPLTNEYRRVGIRIRMFNSKFKLCLTSLVHCMLTERCCLTAGYKWKCNIYHHEGLQTVRVDSGHALYPQNNHQQSAVSLELRHSSSKISQTHTSKWDDSIQLQNYNFIMRNSNRARKYTLS